MRQPIAQLLAAVVLMGSLSGCVFRDPYPEHWPALEVVPESACPQISGTYRNEALYTGFCAANDPYKASWDCDVRLTGLLGGLTVVPPDSRVEIRQPDPDQIVIVTSEGEHVLRRSERDFDCDREGMQVSEHASAMSEKRYGMGTNATWSTLMLIVGTGGVNSLVLHFRKAADGSLVAKLSEKSSGLILAIPFHTSEQHYLRWGAWSGEQAELPAE